LRRSGFRADGGSLTGGGFSFSRLFGLFTFLVFGATLQTILDTILQTILHAGLSEDHGLDVEVFVFVAHGRHGGGSGLGLGFGLIFRFGSGRARQRRRHVGKRNFAQALGSIRLGQVRREIRQQVVGRVVEGLVVFIFFVVWFGHAGRDGRGDCARRLGGDFYRWQFLGLGSALVLTAR